ncbi:MAG: YaiO family outer membrane beta-barrel protein [Woeseiaceae bacterium]
MMRHRTHRLFMLLSTFVVAAALGAEPNLRRIDSAITTADYALALVLIEKGLEETPGDPSLRMRRARVYGYTGDDASALRDLDQLRHEHPYDVDYALARARIFARMGRDDRAIADLRQATALAPEYEEVWQLLLALLSRNQDEATRSEYESTSREAALRFPGAEWWETVEPPDTAAWTAVFGAGHESLDKGLPSWNQQFFELSRDCASWGRYRVGVARDERFDDADISVSLGGDTCFASKWSAGMDVAVVGDAQFLPDLGYSVYVNRTFQDGWVFNVRYRRREYETATVGSMIGTVEKYLGEFRFAYTAGLSHLHGAADSISHGLTVNWYFSEVSSIGLSLNTGEEAESIGPGQVLTTEVRGATLVGRRELSDRLGLQWWLGTHDQGDFYRRQYLGMAITLRL